MSPRHLLAVMAAGAVLIAGCSTEPRATGAPVERPVLVTPAAETTILADDTPGALAIAVSHALFGHAPMVLLADKDDLAAQEEAATRAAELAAPLLLTGAGTDPALRAELGRLDPTVLAPFGERATSWAGEAASQFQVASAGPDLPVASATIRSEPVLVLTTDTPDKTAANATARAGGAQVLSLADPDPRTDSEAIAALAGQELGHVLAIGTEFDPPARLRSRLEVATTGVQLPGGGQVVFPGRRMVALYGHPDTPALGALGEQSIDQAVARALATAADYRELVDEPVVAAFELIATVASSAPGAGGDYSNMTPVKKLRPWVEAAADADIYVVLDLQPGRTDFLTQARHYEELLRLPHVGLALDPEWRLAPDQRHLEQIGSVQAKEVNEVAAWLAELTREHRLPQKLLILHQFRLSMIVDRSELDTSQDELAVLIHADGHGNREQKLATWEALRATAPASLWWGWKNFYDEDSPTFTPAQTVTVEPVPLFISYQ